MEVGGLVIQNNETGNWQCQGGKLQPKIMRAEEGKGNMIVGLWVGWVA